LRLAIYFLLHRGNNALKRPTVASPTHHYLNSRVLLRLDYVASFIVNANHCIM
jgi:hypothetical protein